MNETVSQTPMPNSYSQKVKRQSYGARAHIHTDYPIATWKEYNLKVKTKIYCFTCRYSDEELQTERRQNKNEEDLALEFSRLRYGTVTGYSFIGRENQYPENEHRAHITFEIVFQRDGMRGDEVDDGNEKHVQLYSLPRFLFICPSVTISFSQ